MSHFLEGGDVHPGFSCVITPVDGATVLSLSGELDIATAAECGRGLAEAVASSEPARVVVDMKGVEFCDSSGLSVLISALTGAEASGGVLVLCELHPRIRRVLTLTGLSRRFRTYDTVPEAIAALPRPITS
ncbi:STAS domain-containing protein [Nonomuraea sp. MCN248]|uniref:Anti-sigma factor antagonist n=1 Tax=Nonomuraea corallina TaxID=2989783 RepID=A0ABT4S7U6_9ACTN|nr:STAS domain-containing protein [Nonomuraea corallina]MDA0633254.1 STAS domain-containing protein [Nonomuraea corallina]